MLSSKLSVPVFMFVYILEAVNFELDSGTVLFWINAKKDTFVELHSRLQFWI